MGVSEYCLKPSAQFPAMMISALYRTLSWIFLVLADWHNSPLLDMSLHSGILYWIRASQTFPYYFNCHNITEILLKVALDTIKTKSYYFLKDVQQRSNKYTCCSLWFDLMAMIKA